MLGRMVLRGPPAVLPAVLVAAVTAFAWADVSLELPGAEAFFVPGPGPFVAGAAPAAAAALCAWERRAPRSD